MLFGRGIQRLLSTHSVLVKVPSVRYLSITPTRYASVTCTSSSTVSHSFPWTPSSSSVSVTDKVAEHMAALRPFSAPSPPALQGESMQLTSTLRKRRLKMNKHKHKKLRKRTRALRKRLGK